MGLEEDLVTLEQSIRQLQIEWEKFFGGVERKPPTDLKGRVEVLIRKYAYGEMRNNTDRFRYQTLTARYNTFNELWTKRLRAMEEGRVAGLHGKAAVAAAAAAPPPAARRPGAPGQVRVQDPARDTEAVRTLFDSFMEVRKQTGETGAVKFESFQKIVTQQAARILAEKGAQAVEFRLETKDGKVSLKARPVK
ncbi:MAG TPA: MXAN_5187 C-terminal domain-containing protein [Vicinamibacteria bacterium]